MDFFESTFILWFSLLRKNNNIRPHKKLFNSEKELVKYEKKLFDVNKIPYIKLQDFSGSHHI